jgi:phosphoserine phosphatase
MDFSRLTKILSLSMIFTGRRILYTLYRPKVKLLLVDLDGTLLQNHSTLEDGLILIFKEKKGKKIYNDLMSLISNEKKTPEQIMILAEEYLKQGKFTKTHLEKINATMLAQIDKSLLTTLQQIKKAQIIIATKSSHTLAKNIANKYDFLGGIGTDLKFNSQGLFIDTKVLVANKNKSLYNHIFRTKLALAKKMYSEKFGPIKNKNIGILTDSYADINIMTSVGLAIYLKPITPDAAQRICDKFRLFDKKVTKSNLSKIIEIV